MNPYEWVHRDASLGLDRVSTMPIGSKYLELQAGAAEGLGGFLRAEGGWRVTEPLAAFVFAQAGQQGGLGAGLGVRFSIP